MHPSPPLADEVLYRLPPEWPLSALLAIQGHLAATSRKVVVLDDDPTGTQTVYGLPVLTEWPVAALQVELENDLAAFYVLTNSRSLPLPWRSEGVGRSSGAEL